MDEGPEGIRLMRSRKYPADEGRGFYKTVKLWRSENYGNDHIKPCGENLSDGGKTG